MSKPGVSIVVPTYNDWDFLKAALQSVREQAWRDFEVIVVNDGGSADADHIVRAMDDRRFRLIRQANAGLAAARNTGWRAARGTYLLFLDADDLLRPDALATQVSWLASNPDVDAVAGGHDFIDAEGRYVASSRPWEGVARLDLEALLFNCPIVTHAVLMRQSFLERVGGFDERLRRVEDWDLWLRAAVSGCRIGWNRLSVCAYRLHSRQMTRDATEQAHVARLVLERCFSLPNFPPELRAVRNEALARLYLTCAGRQMAVGQTDDARLSIERAVEELPGLATTRADEVVESLLAWTDHPLIDDPNAFARCALDSLSPAICVDRRIRRAVLGEVALKTLFQAYRNRRWDHVRRSSRLAFANTPRRWFNRGVMSITAQAISDGWWRNVGVRT